MRYEDDSDDANAGLDGDSLFAEVERNDDDAVVTSLNDERERDEMSGRSGLRKSSVFGLVSFPVANPAAGGS